MRRSGTARLLLTGLAALACACPAIAAAQDRVLVTAAGRDAVPGDVRFVAELAPGLRVYSAATPPGVTAERHARRLSRRAGIFAAQADGGLRRADFFNMCISAPAEIVTTPAGFVGALNAAPPDRTGAIAVLDTGVDPSAPELAGRVAAGYDATTGQPGSGDDDGHGTQVAAVAAAAPGLFQGVSPTSPVLPVRIFDAKDDTTAEWVVRAIQTAVQRGAKVINISGSNPRTGAEATAVTVVQQAINAAFARGVITVAAAGNESSGDPTIPGSFPHVLNVASAGSEGARHLFSNFGPTIDLASPADGLVVPAPKARCPSGFGTATGTSFAAPAVAGAVAVIAARRPDLTTQQLFDLVRTTAARDVGVPGRDDETGFGILDVGAGLDAAPPAKEATELDDDVFWLTGAYRRRHPVLLRTRRSASLKGIVSAAKDPQDVYPVQVRKGQILTARATIATGTEVEVGIWSGDTGPFDVSAGSTIELLRSTDGFTAQPVVSWRAKRTGRYYVSVEAPDVPTPAQVAEGTAVPAAQDRYTLSLRKSGKAAKSRGKR